MKNSVIPRYIGIAGLSLCCNMVSAQNDGDHPATDPNGETYLAPDAIVGAGIQPTCFTVGTTASLPQPWATLRVRGDELPVDDEFFSAFKATFRTDVGANINQTWDMVRGQYFIGRLYNTSDFNGFHLQAMQPDGSAWIENSDQDGFQLFSNGPTATPLNGFTCDRLGFASLGSTNAMVQVLTPNGPWSRFHLVHEEQGANEPYFGFRPWQRNGVTMTGWSDFVYLGQKYNMGVDGEGPEEDDNTDVVLAVGDEELEAADANTFNNISFRFLGANGVDGSAGTIEGLEMMRLRPYRATANDPIIGRVGVGDFVNNAAVPEESLDILEGKVRVRSLPTDAVSTSNELVTVNMTTGNLEHRPANALPDNCEWTMDTSSPNHVITAVGSPLGSCPDREENVGIGQITPVAKLDVYDFTPDASNDITGIKSRVEGASDLSFGVDALVQTGIGFGRYGVRSITHNATFQSHGIDGRAHLGAGVNQTGLEHGNRGVFGLAWLQGGTTGNNFGVDGIARITSGTTVYNIGVQGFADGGHSASARNVGVQGIGSFATTNYGGRFFATEPAVTNYGIRASALFGSTSNWAGWFDGNVNIQGGNLYINQVFAISDSQFKTNVNDLTNGTDVIMQLVPKTYELDPSVHPTMGLEPGLQGGLLAQELEQILPNLVRTVDHPAEYDSLGIEIVAAFQYKAVNYDGLFPYIISALKDQVVLNQAQADQILAMQQDLAACCADGRMMHGTGSDGQSDGVNELRASDAADQRLTITPNPFSEGTVIGYSLRKAGMVSLQVSDASGKSLFNLFEGQQMEGTQRYDWNTSFLAPGMYHVTLLVDGAPLVKKAVKVAR